ncbi:MAG: hypothetical protein OQJ93_06460 [Ignavibacteriaceae bacterium]|nr:hypothetical protein [Ignavibacteriaceae bacterium]MCW8812229.1 hypothetical protein [Chlorobium sp.]MCW8818364.1 hypothetical protein [Ignavibacteriaceae bacterium]MCW8824030.1 hypothetical protein [Ignavibacteriaceae bacterium]MCW8961617.1 hypothetical protein [Ignavibacteriaceae bacterium]
MKLSVLFIITAIIAIVYGVVFVIIPGPVYSIYGIESNMVLDYMGRLFGSALIAVGLISWQSRNAADSDARKAIIFSFFIADGIGFIVALIGQLNEVVNPVGWTTVVIYFILSFGFAYFQFSKPGSAAS